MFKGRIIWVSAVYFGREEEAKVTTIAAPTKDNGPIDVMLKKQGVIDMDYDVIDQVSGQTWMLIDTVYTFTSIGIRKYFWKIAANSRTTKIVVKVL